MKRPFPGQNPYAVPAKATLLHEMTPKKLAEMEKLYGPVSKDAVMPLPPEKVMIGDREMTDYKLICPRCHRYMKLRQGPHGPFYGCTGYPYCRTLQASDLQGNPKGEPKIKGGSSRR